MLWVYLSPHLDDIALSCGGLVWEQVQAGDKVEIWTLCAGDPPSAPLSDFAQGLHNRWQTSNHAGAASDWQDQRYAPSHRRTEDMASCARLGARPRHFALPDCIYRTDSQGNHLYASEEAIFGPVHPAEDALIMQWADQLQIDLPADAGSQRQRMSPTSVVVPITVGMHADHRLTRAIAEKLGRPLWYYPDFPYVLSRPHHLGQLIDTAWASQVFPVSEPGLSAWVESIAAHASQLSTFWPDLVTARAALRGYTALVGGARLWRTH